MTQRWRPRRARRLPRHGGQSGARCPGAARLGGSARNRSPCRRGAWPDAGAAVPRTGGSAAPRRSAGRSAGWRARWPGRAPWRAGCRSRRRGRGAWSRPCRGRSGSGPSPRPPFGGERGAVEGRAGPVDRVGPTEPIQQDPVGPGQGGLVPVAQPSPAGHARPAPHLLRQPLPADAGAQHGDDALQAGPVRHPPRPASFRLGWLGWPERRDPPPQGVGNERSGHARLTRPNTIGSGLIRALKPLPRTATAGLPPARRWHTARTRTAGNPASARR
jgi:hypothetical protein